MKNEGVVFEKNQAAAHIVASGGSKGHWQMSAESRKLLQKYSISVDTAANGVPLSSKSHGATHTRVFHQSVFTRLSDAEKMAIDFLDNAGIIETDVRNAFIRNTIEGELRTIGEELLLGLF